MIDSFMCHHVDVTSLENTPYILVTGVGLFRGVSRSQIDEEAATQRSRSSQ